MGGIDVGVGVRVFEVSLRVHEVRGRYGASCMGRVSWRLQSERERLRIHRRDLRAIGRERAGIAGVSVAASRAKPS